MNNPYTTYKDQFVFTTPKFWQLQESGWVQVPKQPDLTVASEWYVCTWSPFDDSETWQHFIADGCDNPGVRSRKVEKSALPALLKLALTLTE